jgi:predicted permease
MTFYRALLALYPKEFRRQYRDELCRAFVERTRGRSWPGRIAAAIADVVPNALAARWEILRRRPAPQTVLATVWSDVRFALRQIRRTPLLSGVIIAVVALGIGINAGMLTVVNAHAWQPAPGIPPDGALARLRPAAARETGAGTAEIRLSYPDVLDLRGRRDVFAEVAAWESTDLPVDLGSGPETIFTSFTTSDFFRALRVPFAAGAGFTGDLDQSGARVAVIGHSIWMAQFGGSPDAIGQTIRVMNQPFTIVGVAPPAFAGVDSRNQGRRMVWLPLGARATIVPSRGGDLMRRDATTLLTVARLAPDVRPADVERLTAELTARLEQAEPATHARLTLRAERLTGIPSGTADRTELVAAVVLIAVLIVVITCTNVSALLLGRAAARRREIAVRLSLGATRLRLIRQMLTESLVLALAGALVGLALYILTIKIAYAQLPDVVYGLQPNAATFMYAMLFALASTIVFGLAPALHASSSGIGEAIKNSGTHARRRAWLQRTFVVIQLACSQPVLVMTSLVLADLRRSADDNAAEAPASVLTMSSMIFRPQTAGAAASSRDPDTGARPEVLRAIRERILAIPGVQAAALGTEGAVPAQMVRLWRDSFELPGGRTVAPVWQLYVSAGYLATYGIPLLHGRAIGVEEDHPGSNVVVVNQAAAVLLWPGEDPVGKRLIRRGAGGKGGTRSFDVIGLVGTAPYDSEASSPMVFAPLSLAASGWSSTIAVRVSGDGRTYVPSVREAIREVEPYAATSDVNTLAERYAGDQREVLQENAAAFAVGAAALLLASLGLYATIAFGVVQRTREIGIRLALGATRGRVVGQFFRSGIAVAAIGLAIGLPVTVAGIHVVKASLLGFTIRSVATVTVVVPVLVIVAALASWLPARRAGRVDPMVALRNE